MRLLTCLVALCSLIVCAGAVLPPDADMWLTMPDAIWTRTAPENKVTVELRLQRKGGEWNPLVFGTAYHGFNMATHYGYILDSTIDGDTTHMRVMMRFQPDPWIGRRANVIYYLILNADGTKCTGTWQGAVHETQQEGKLTGTVEIITPTPGFKPPTPDEHPRLLVRKADLPALRAKAETPDGKNILAALKAAKGDVVAQAMAYTLSNDAQYAANARAIIENGFSTNAYYTIGGQAHLAAAIAVEHLIAYDMVYDTCDAALHARVREYLRDKLWFSYWGMHNTQFNPNDTSNWSLMYRAGCGLISMTLLDSPWTPALAIAPPPLDIAPVKDLIIGAGVPVVKHDAAMPIGPWLIAPGIKEAYDADPFPGGMGAARPEIGTLVRDVPFALVDDETYVAGATDITTASKRAYFHANYLYCVLDVQTPGTYRIETTKQEKGIRYREIWLGGRKLITNDFVKLEPGRYPLLCRVFLEPMGNWEYAKFWLKLSPVDEASAVAWHADKLEEYNGDVIEQNFLLEHKQQWNPEALRWLGQAAWKTEAYARLGLGENGWNLEGEAYTRHATRLAFPFAQCWSNLFGRNLAGMDHMGKILALCTAATVYGPTSANMQSYCVGGGPLGVDTYARGFGFLPKDLQPAVLWSWNKTRELAAAGRLASPYKIVATEDGTTLAMRLINFDPEMVPLNPGESMPRVTVDCQKGGYIFRNRWQDADDCVAWLFSNSNNPGGSWNFPEAGTFRLTGLGVDWAVRGQGWGNGASGRIVKDTSLNQNMVDVGEQNLQTSNSAWTTAFARADDGSGIVSLDMNEVYRHTPMEAYQTTGKLPVTAYRSTGADQDLGIRALRSMAVDYSATSGAPCLLAVADHLTGAKGDNAWQMTIPREHTIKIEGDHFTITAKNGATLVGTVVTPGGATITVKDTNNKHEVNYQGSHAQSVFLTRTIRVAGTDADQSYLVVMTIQKGEAPVVTIANGVATIGKQTVTFDGKAITLGSFTGKAEPVPVRPTRINTDVPVNTGE